MPYALPVGAAAAAPPAGEPELRLATASRPAAAAVAACSLVAAGVCPEMLRPCAVVAGPAAEGMAAECLGYLCQQQGVGCVRAHSDARVAQRTA